MAERTDVDPTPEAVTEEAAAEPKKKGLGKLLLVVLPLVLVPATAGALLTYTQLPAVMQAASAFGLGFGEGEKEDAEKPIEYGQFAKLEKLVINPAGTGGKRFLLVDLGLESPTAEVITELADKDIVVRDTVLRVLSAHGVEELTSLPYRAELRDKLLTAVNGVLQTGKVERLYFTEYVLQ